MNRTKLSKERISQILGAKSREVIKVPFYYAPRFFDQVHEQLQRRLMSKGGRPSVAEWQIVRKTRYSTKTWQCLKHLATEWSRGGASISPAQIAAKIVDQAVSR
ncbi:MAG: hypothetical protein COZ72_01820 [Elusimicrobia bacterium CG_4_8_14_3_um_filter_50_9]|nr:MAG: hypothetical protein COZ72_01820 [Elusimicrobia bacterium CG_4_8_14_3_um_filter_50_9]